MGQALVELASQGRKDGPKAGLETGQAANITPTILRALSWAGQKVKRNVKPSKGPLGGGRCSSPRATEEDARGLLSRASPRQITAKWPQLSLLPLPTSSTWPRSRPLREDSRWQQKRRPVGARGPGERLLPALSLLASVFFVCKGVGFLPSPTPTFCSSCKVRQDVLPRVASIKRITV